MTCDSLSHQQPTSRSAPTDAGQGVHLATCHTSRSFPRDLHRPQTCSAARRRGRAEDGASLSTTLNLTLKHQCRGDPFPYPHAVVHCRWARISTRILDSPLREGGVGGNLFCGDTCCRGQNEPVFKRHRLVSTAAANSNGRRGSHHVPDIRETWARYVHTRRLWVSAPRSKRKGEEEPANKLQLLRFFIRAAAAAE
ncbi:hypothetical protein SEVIR_5G312450v4 [Setaria viridis]